MVSARRAFWLTAAGLAGPDARRDRRRGGQVPAGSRLPPALLAQHRVVEVARQLRRRLVPLRHLGIGVDPAVQQIPAAEQEEDHHAEQSVDHVGRDEQPERGAGQPAARHHPVRDRAEDADRREAARAGAVDDQQAHQHRVDPVPPREGQADRGDDRDRRGDDGAERGEDRDDDEHHPRDQRDPTADEPHRGLHEPVDRPVVLGDREQVRDADEDDEQVRREVGEHLVREPPRRPRARRRRTRRRRPARPCSPAAAWPPGTPRPGPESTRAPGASSTSCWWRQRAAVAVDGAA